MERKGKILRLLTALLAGVVLLGAAGLLFIELPSPSTMLPGGERVWLDGVTVGPVYQLDRRSMFPRLASFFPGASKASKEGLFEASPSASIFPLSTRVVGTWLRCSTKHEAAIERLVPALEDEHGCKSMPAAVHRAFPERWHVQLPVFEPVFPGSQQLTLKLQDGTSGAAQAAFGFENPSYSPYAQWSAPPFPVTAETKRVRLRVNGFRRSRKAWDFAHLKATIAGRQPEGEAWEPRWADVSNAGATSSGPAAFMKSGMLMIPNLCFHDAAWKVNLVLARPPATKAPEDFRISPRPIRVIGSDGDPSAPSYEIKATGQGVMVAVNEAVACAPVAGAPPQVRVLVSASAPKPGVRITLQTVNGVPLQLLLKRLGWRGAGALRNFTFAEDRLSTGGYSGAAFVIPFAKLPRHIALVFAVHRHEEVSFLVSPRSDESASQVAMPREGKLLQAN